MPTWNCKMNLVCLNGYGLEPAPAHQAQAAKGPRIPLVEPATKNVIWEHDFMNDSL